MTPDETRKEIYRILDELPDKYLLEVLLSLKKIVTDATFVKNIDKIIEENRELLTKLAE